MEISWKMYYLVGSITSLLAFIVRPLIVDVASGRNTLFNMHKDFTKEIENGEGTFWFMVFMCALFFAVCWPLVIINTIFNVVFGVNKVPKK